MQTFTHVIQDPLGLHARPAGLLVKAASAYQSGITVTTDSGTADAKRILSLMRLAAKQGTALTLRIEGDDELAAAQNLKTFLLENL